MRPDAEKLQARSTHLDKEQTYFPLFQVVKTLYLLIMKQQGRKKKKTRADLRCLSLSLRLLKEY